MQGVIIEGRIVDLFITELMILTSIIVEKGQWTDFDEHQTTTIKAFRIVCHAKVHRPWLLYIATAMTIYHYEGIYRV